MRKGKKLDEDSAVPKKPRFQLPGACEAALLLVHLLERTSDEFHRTVTRAQLSEETMRKLWGRTRVTDQHLLETQEYLLRAGWVMFWMGTSYAVVKLDAVEGWPRIASKRIAEDLKKVAR